jgi:hypothetical protein
MKPLIETFDSLKPLLGPNTKLSTSQGQSYVAHAIGIRNTWYPVKQMIRPPSDTIHWGLWEFRESAKRKENAVSFMPAATNHYSANSITALLSQHWNPRQSDLESLQGAAVEFWLNQAEAKPSPAINGGYWFWVKN